MKKILIGFLLGISFLLLLNAGIDNYIVNKQTAEVSKILGLPIFTDCYPVLEYDVLGEVKVSSAFALSDDYGSRRNALVKKVKKQFPTAEGILLYPQTDGLSSTRAEAIKFKTKE